MTPCSGAGESTGELVSLHVLVVCLSHGISKAPFNLILRLCYSLFQLYGVVITLKTTKNLHRLIKHILAIFYIQVI